ncbi:Mrm1p KNAG_0A03300 [Huiozyma naganishii CBS 8797]|uniref:rRNA methyltransferase 1, mitochondrial n=1 Tax=Huiozyma naganishii (strain ATCC MYA-139 / BCRC 22969 / CBS 8797 / KCTC 17520 / NBRC 10181 / NCYC 3082 / Yp74L-3) TaxID=1071383 RepID=J7RTH1_HUIN7|nr:hypothetical protein KNAG_0A03300 [Kazachstania naganishii CBS 8797]CCK68017.1 hypothetical protein KNAG_0A03300 [Kazachstania naganishii CBS 8797]
MLYLRRAFSTSFRDLQHRATRKSRSSFDKSFDSVAKRKAKAWESSDLDKDTWFKKKYSHVHANRSPTVDRYGKKAAHLDKLAHLKEEGKERRLEHRSKFGKRHAYSGLAVNPLMEYVYGTNCVLAALHNPNRQYYSRLLYSTGHVNPKIEEVIKEREIEIECTKTDKHELNLLTKNGAHNGVVLETKPIEPKDLSYLGVVHPENPTFEVIEDAGLSTVKYVDSGTKQFPLGVYLDEITDPHNLGAIIRSAYYLGADFLVVSQSNCAPLSPVVNKASSGAMEFMLVYSVDNPVEFAAKSQDVGGWTFVAGHLADPAKKGQYDGKNIPMTELSTLPTRSPTILMVGNEGAGVRSALRTKSDFLVQIPTARPDSPVDSLNVSVATALLLNHLLPAE